VPKEDSDLQGATAFFRVINYDSDLYYYNCCSSSRFPPLRSPLMAGTAAKEYLQNSLEALD
jgi:hypothetical protein